MVEDHTTDTLTDSRVYVNGHRVPIADVDIHMRREGPCSVTTYAEAQIASPFEGVDYIEAFNGLNKDEQEAFDLLHIEVKDYETDNYHTQFHGMVTGVGNGEGPSRIFNCRAQGAGHFVDKITARKQFSAEMGQIRIETVLSYIAERMEEATPDDFTVEVGANTGEEFETDLDSLDLVSSAIRTPPNRFTKIVTHKTFSPNRHTLSDVISWLENKADVRVWFVPSVDGARLFALDQPRLRKHQAHYLDGNLRVVSNDALAELRPMNTLVGKGTALKSYQNNDGSFGFSSSGSRYAEAKARHETLYRRAGSTGLVADTQLETDAESKTEVENETRRELARRIEETTGGTMTTLIRAPISPYDTIEAQPTCNEEAGTTTEPLTYQVDRVHFKLRGEGASTCDLNVGVRVDPTEDIVVAESSWRDI